MRKACKFKPEIGKSEQSLNQVVKQSRQRSSNSYSQVAPSDQVRGLQTHIERQMLAKARKLQEEEAFLLPSQRKQLQKMRIKEA